jgi:hypothetical protein
MTTKYYKKKAEVAESDLGYATSAMFDAWAMLRVIDKEQTDELDLHAVINCAIARLELALNIMECMKNDK